MVKVKRAYVLYGTEAYFPVMEQCALSITDNSNVCVLIYCINSVFKSSALVGRNIVVIPWAMRLSYSEMYTTEDDGNFYIKRNDANIYAILTERIKIVKHALQYRAETVVYIDSDSVATENIDRIFDMYHDEPYVMATEGIYEWMLYDGRGACETRNDMTGTLEHNACQLFDVDQSVRNTYRTTNLFIAGQRSLGFIDSWWYMVSHVEVLFNRKFYAPYHEETLYNVLLWKHKYLKGLPYLYMNGSVEEMSAVYNSYKFTGHTHSLGEWKKLPARQSDLLVMHGEKRISKMAGMRAIVKKNKKKIRILYLAPHLSTGGMPAFLLKRIIAISNSDVEITVVEYANWSDEYVVHKNEIKRLVDHFYTLEENKMELINIINLHNINIVHVEEMIDDGFNNFPVEFMNALYDNDRTWKIVETCHNIAFDPDTEKKYHPDGYVFCTPFHENTFKNMPSKKWVIEYPIVNKIPTADEKLIAKHKLGLNPSVKHVLNVGLWTSGKNQSEGVNIARKIPNSEFHFVGNQAINFKSYWNPIMTDVPKNVTVWGERSDIETFMIACDVFMFNSTWECNPLVLREAASYGLPILARNLPQYQGMFDGYIFPIEEGKHVQQLESLLTLDKNPKTPLSSAEFDFKSLTRDVYNEVLASDKMLQSVNINLHFIKQPFLEITGRSNKNYEVRFYDENDICIYNNIVKANHWVKVNREWFTRWSVKVWEAQSLIYDTLLDYADKRVYITFESSSLGDTLAWMPYVEEFQKKHKCHVVVSTFKNYLFKESYPDIEFVEPGTNVSGIQGMYSLGWFYDQNKEPTLPNTIPLQKSATNILGIEYKEIKPRIDFTPNERCIKNKYVTIATNSTAGCKFWTKEGWQKVINHLSDEGYEVVNVSLEDNPFENCSNLQDRSMTNTMNMIHHSEFFIGLSSGLSWLAWALDKQVVMISNFSEVDHEFDCIRVIKKNVCNGCWNSPKYKFDKSWNWCPVHTGTPRMFECQTSITAEDVINVLPL